MEECGKDSPLLQKFLAIGDQGVVTNATSWLQWT